jgi:D-alanyl-D-alanine carboxypeptidase
MNDFSQVYAYLDSFIPDELPKRKLPALALGLTDRDQLLHVGTYGFANLGNRQPVEAGTLFEIGSISKSFACILALQLHEQGALDLHAPLTEYLPWFEVRSTFEPITLHHIMSHTAGLIEGSDMTMSAVSAAYALRRTQVTAAPGTYFHYSNDGFKILGLVLQAVTGESMTDLLSMRIFQPLGMTDSRTVITNSARRRLAVGYEAAFDDRPLPSAGKLAPATWLESDTADGSICSTAADMCRYLRMLLNHGAPLMSPQSFELFTHPVIPTGDDLHGEHYAYGLFTQQLEGHACIGHSGGMVGYSAFILADLDAGLGAVTLVNGPGESEDIARHALVCLRAEMEKHDLPAAPNADPFHIDNAEEYTGEYRQGDRTLRFKAEGQRLFLVNNGGSTPLERLEKDCFYAGHPEFDLFAFSFQRQDGKVTAVGHGEDWYSRTDADSAAAPAVPPAWQAYPGHYRSHNPWLSNFRVVLRHGQLLFIYPGWEEEPLEELDIDVFRLGSDPRSPERLVFGPVIDGKTILVNLSGCEYCRFFTP